VNVIIKTYHIYTFIVLKMDIRNKMQMSANNIRLIFSIKSFYGKFTTIAGEKQKFLLMSSLKFMACYK